MFNSALPLLLPRWATAATLLLAAGICPHKSFAATPPYGVTYLDQGYCGVTGVEIQNSKRLTYNHQFDATGTNGAVCDLHGTIKDGKVYGYALAATGSGYDGSAYAGMDAYFFDTFSIAGPSGESGQFNVTMTVNGTDDTACSGSCTIGDLVDSFNLLQNGTVIPGVEYSGIIATIYVSPGAKAHQTMTVTITLDAGTKVVLGELLQLRDVVVDEGAPGQITLSGSHDMQQAGFITVTPVTSGFSFTTASGLTYAPAASGDGSN